MSYSEDLMSIVRLDIPKSKKREIGFLELIGQEYKENINSRVYEYFLNQAEHREIADLFLNALLNVIEYKTLRKFKIEDFDCTSEVPTKSGNRIDLLIKDNEGETGIIIENKLFHYLNNNLKDYWNHLAFEEENKIGIVLTLNKCDIPIGFEKQYINITHQEWMNAIKTKGLPIKMDFKKYVYLNDFITTIEQITKDESMDSETKFFFENVNQINRAIEIHNHAYNYIIGQIQVVADNLGWKVYGKNPTFWRNIWNEESQPNAYYTICFDDLFNEKREILLVIELFQNAMYEADRLDKALEGNVFIKKLKRRTEKTDNYMHFATQSYSLNIEEINNLSTFILSKINQEFKPVMDVILESLNAKT